MPVGTRVCWRNWPCQRGTRVTGPAGLIRSVLVFRLRAPPGCATSAQHPVALLGHRGAAALGCQQISNQRSIALSTLVSERVRDVPRTICQLCIRALQTTVPYFSTVTPSEGLDRRQHERPTTQFHEGQYTVS